MKKQSKNQKWDSALYDDKHGFIHDFGREFVEFLDPQKGEVILDLGTGTGNLANLIHEKGGNVIGIDASQEMIVKAKYNYPNIDFSVQDANYLDFHNEFDSVFSNAVLHWITTPELVISGVYEALKSGGRFVAEFGGKGNVIGFTNAANDTLKEMGYEIPTFPWYFPSIGEYTSLLEKAGFNVVYARLYDRPTKLSDGEDGLRNWAKMFGSKLIANVPSKKHSTIMKSIENKLIDKLSNDGNWYMDYRRIRVVGIKPKGEL